MSLNDKNDIKHTNNETFTGIKSYHKGIIIRKNGAKSGEKMCQKMGLKNVGLGEKPPRDKRTVS